MTALDLGVPAVPGAATSTTDTRGRPSDPRLIDSWGRVATDLRVSLTDRCNLRCTYCMPAEGLEWMPGEQALTDDEVVRLVRVAVERLGVQEIRFTGGEPLLRKGLEDIVAATAALSPRPEMSVTTNALGLTRRAPALAAAGLDRVNVSLDTLRRDRFTEITRRDRLDDVLAGLRAAREHGLDPIKVNTVLMPGLNDDEAPDLLAWALEEGYELRIIEQMPLDAGHSWQRDRMITAEQVLASLRTRFTLTEDPAERGGAPAERFLVDGWTTPDGTPAKVGIIASVTRPFCGNCDRTRLTADGQVRNCLFSGTENDLRGLLRGGGSDDDIADAWRVAMWGKKPGHGIDDPGFLQPDRPMSAIGG
ncbi:GTP 3',8-cyclase MoaA [Actinomycetospora straminea]|uniref:GTP 3',8-cyclase n=1 Tax=Actinomycetospora straminea TaxID=663607 RepID=A0ABP9EAC0_9PSEU|nr:GTP 3',8-cyclase MoaA [Actinomycetospora straminea]MDD7932072.1 GTP 3',8-cyclase MoaA [Actinomycetospora straminea]